MTKIPHNVFSYKEKCKIMTKLVIVESPTKAKTLTSILGKDYIVEASMGHVRDLPKKNMGIDIEHDYAPEYEIPAKAKKNITKLKKVIKEADEVILATDPDREGEAIAWHLAEILKSTKGVKKSMPFSRVVFHEITKEAIEEAFLHATQLNMDLVDAQQARRVLDRLVGYRLSPLLWKKVRYGLSAGRVQSVAVRLIVEKERERGAFDAVEYWSISGDFENSKKLNVTANLVELNGNKLEIGNEKEAKKIEQELNDTTYSVKEIKNSERNRKPSAPFKTSTLQQTAANVYGFSAKRTMSAAQKLFEFGFITYHRTDSLTLSTQFIENARNHLKKELGDAYIPNEIPEYKTKSKNAQEAHEAIRPTKLDVKPAQLKGEGLANDEIKLYSLILKRSLESQSVSAVYDQTAINIESKNGYLFRANGSVIKFEGWLAIGKLIGLEDDLENLDILPELKEGESVELKTLKPEQHFTQPPARYSDATLIKALEERGIGRPSTYAPTISTILARKYVRKEQRYFVPEDVALVVTDLLVEHFPKVSDYDFTANMEDDLDEIAEGNKEWVPVIREFYEPFTKIVDEKDKELNKADFTKLGESEEMCPECGKILYIKLGKYGKFLSCSGFPECEYAKPMEEDIPLDENGNEISDFGACEACEDGKMMLKQGRFGKFLACSNYPKCKTTKPYLDRIGMKCPTCETGDVILKKAKGRIFYGCSNYPECKYASWKNPMESKDGDSQESTGDNED